LPLGSCGAATQSRLSRRFIATCAALPSSELGGRLREAERAVVIWSGDGPVD